MGVVAPLFRLLIVLAVALQSFGALRGVHASHAHAGLEGFAAEVACLHDEAGHTHPASPADPADPSAPNDTDCPTCDLFAVMAKGFAAHPVAAGHARRGAGRACRAPPTECAPSAAGRPRDRASPMNSNRSV